MQHLGIAHRQEFPRGRRGRCGWGFLLRRRCGWHTRRRRWRWPGRALFPGIRIRKLATHEHGERPLLALGWRLQVMGRELRISGDSPGPWGGRKQHAMLQLVAPKHVWL